MKVLVPDILPFYDNQVAPRGSSSSEADIAMEDLETTHDTAALTLKDQVDAPEDGKTATPEPATYTDPSLESSPKTASGASSEDDEISNEWKCIGYVIDRLFFWITLVTVTIVTPIMLGRHDQSY